jgi:hypothetical protein
MPALVTAVHRGLVNIFPRFFPTQDIIDFLACERAKALLEGLRDQEDVGTGFAEEAEDRGGRLLNEEQVRASRTEEHIADLFHLNIIKEKSTQVISK